MPLAKKNKASLPALDAIEVDYYTKELGRPLQRQWLQRRLDDIHAASHHVDDAKPETRDNPPREDRAG